MSAKRNRPERTAFADRPPTDRELERIRLCLSTYQDGSGMLAAGEGATLPGWRDFERAVAFALGGQASESKAIFDVVVPKCDAPGPHYGISCKMRRELDRIDRDGRVTIEVSNSAGKFWDCLGALGIDQRNYKRQPGKVGPALVHLVRSWHEEDGKARDIMVAKSCYLVLSWSKSGDYQFHQYPLDLVASDELRWHCPPKARKPRAKARRLCGDDKGGTLVEWYGESGGQLKFYPLGTDAKWQSDRFRLEPLPPGDRGIGAKAEQYFPDLWHEVCGDIRG